MSNHKNEIVSCQTEKMSKYSSSSLIKGLELARRVSFSSKSNTIEATVDKSEQNQCLSRQIWKCVNTILYYEPETIEHISVSPNGKIFAIKSSTNDKAIDIWEIENTKLIKTIICSSPKIFEISDDSRKIIICERNNLSIRSIYSEHVAHQIKFLISNDIDNEKSVCDLSLNSYLLTDWDSSVVISSGLNLIVAHYENKIYVWDIATGDLLQQFISQHNSDIDRTLFIASESPTLVVYDSYSSLKPEGLSRSYGDKLCLFK